VPSANIRITLARFASSARIVRLVARRSSSVRSSVVSVSATRRSVPGRPRFRSVYESRGTGNEFSEARIVTSVLPSLMLCRRSVQ